MAYYNGNNFRGGHRQPTGACPQQAPRQVRPSRVAPAEGMRPARPQPEGCSQVMPREAVPPCGCSQNMERETAPSCGCGTDEKNTPKCNMEDRRMSEKCTTGAAPATGRCVVPSPCCPVAMAYIPMQPFEEPFDAGKAFMLGTSFPSLLKPFMAGGKCR